MSLTDQLHHTEERIANTAEHLVKLNDVVNRSRGPLPEDERVEMEKKLDTLQQTVSVKLHYGDSLLQICIRVSGYVF